MPYPEEPVFSADQNQTAQLLRDALNRLAVLEKEMENQKASKFQLGNRATYLESRLDALNVKLAGKEKLLADLTYRHEQLAVHLGNQFEKVNERIMDVIQEVGSINSAIKKLVTLQDNGLKIDQGLQDAQSRAFWMAMEALSAVVELSNEVRSLKGGNQK
jgi:chromosome segregation ATPase